MGIIGLFVAFVLLIGGFAAAQMIFMRMNRRMFWRAMIPPETRIRIFPSDPVKMDPFMALEEWAAFLFLGACLTLPLIALNAMGLIGIFN